MKEFPLEFFAKYRNLKNIDIEFRGVIVYSIMHLALLGAIKRLILFWKEFHIDYLQCSDHKSLGKLEEIVGLLPTEPMR